MLKSIHLKNFKCFKTETRVSFSKMNVLTGQNARGKSTVLQSLLLMHQSLEFNSTIDYLLLNGKCVNLGKYDNIRNSTLQKEEPIIFSFNFEKKDLSVEIEYKLKRDNTHDLIARIFSTKIIIRKGKAKHEFKYVENKKNGKWNNLILINDDIIDKGLQKNLLKTINFKQIHYLAADRISPQDYYRKYSETNFLNVGAHGERTAHILYEYKNENIDEQLILETSETNTLHDQAEAWLSKIFDGVKIDVRDVDAKIVLMKFGSTSSYFYDPNNTGFGLTYTLPIIVSCLLAKEGDIIIVENPEAHLHPSAQSRLANLLCKTANRGVQIIIETHSDHILNGVRLSVLEKILEKDEINIQYFSDDLEKPIIKIDIDEKGKIKEWPEGFFDQLTNDFKKLFGV
jgi:predicted ATPase